MLMLSSRIEVAIIGAGASGVFTAIQIKEMNPNISVAIFESGRKCLQKVRISGGGRCNVTHDLYDISELAQKYPRGNRELRGPFSVFQPKDMLNWLHDSGVKTKVEGDGRIFPVSDSSETIIECFLQKLRDYGVDIFFNHSLVYAAKDFENGEFHLKFKNESELHCKHLVLSTGSSSTGHKLAEAFGMRITPTAPSLFTFQIKDNRLNDLAGISFQKVALTLLVNKKKFSETGPLLITHWGLSGPAIIKLSAWAARELKANGYQAMLRVSFAPELNEDQVRAEIKKQSEANSAKKLLNSKLSFFTKRYWEKLLFSIGISNQKTWTQLSKKETNRLINEVINAEFSVIGKGVFKEEFVTCGGVSLKNVNCKTMSSKSVENLYFTGEILDVDGITGGFNFQNAWTSGYLAAQSIAQI